MYFTICIPTYNRTHTIVRTLDSINRQAFKDFEVIVVDDGSTDNLGELIEAWMKENNQEIRYIYKENGGKHSALNVGIHNAEGKFFVILDSDDWLADDALERLHILCRRIEENDEFSGVMARSQDMTTGEMIGDPFKEEPMISSYIDYHFVLPYKMKVRDCFECNKTEILQQYRYPENSNTKFVPEAWLFDQVGVKYKLYCTNDILHYKEYQPDGISNDTVFKKKNIVGYLYHYASRIENVLPYTKLPFKNHVVAWWRYWEAVKMDENNIGPRCQKITFLGRIVKLFIPFITWLYKVLYGKRHVAGR